MSGTMLSSTQSKPDKKRVRLNLSLHPGQHEVSISPARFRVVACGRQWGKSRLGSGEAFAAALEGKSVWWVAPDYPLAQIGWRLIKGLARQIPGVEVRESERMLLFPSGGWLQVKSGHAEGALRGATLDLLVVDEAAFMERERWEAELRPTLSVRQGRALFLSTFNGENWFYALFERGQSERHPEWESWRKPTVDNPHVDPAEVEDARVSMSPAEFAQEYLALVSTGVDSIFEREMFRDRHSVESHYQNLAVGRWITIDTAYKDSDAADYTAWCVADLSPDYRMQVTHVGAERLQFPDLVRKLEELAMAYNYDGKLRGIVIEDTGAGTSVLQALGADTWLGAYLSAFKVGSRKKTERAREAAVWCRRGCVMLPESSEASAWLYDFENELFRFPSVDYDDRTDSFVMMVLYLTHLLEEGYHVRTQAIA